MKYIFIALIQFIALARTQFFSDEKFRYTIKWNIVYKNKSDNYVSHLLYESRYQIPGTECTYQRSEIDNYIAISKVLCRNKVYALMCPLSKEDFKTDEKSTRNELNTKNFLLTCKVTRQWSLKERRKKELEFELNNKVPY